MILLKNFSVEWNVRLQNSHCIHHTTVCCLPMYVQCISIDIWRLASSIVSMLQVGYLEGKSTIPLMRERAWFQ